MIRHLVESCPDDLALLQQRLDALAAAGSEVLSVLWQPRRVDEAQAAAYDASGSFVIVARGALDGVLRERGAALAEPL